jgi:hypothetical protein
MGRGLGLPHDSEAKAGEILIETEADDILENCFNDHRRDGITKGKPLVTT